MTQKILKFYFDKGRFPQHTNYSIFAGKAKFEDEEYAFYFIPHGYRHGKPTINFLAEIMKAKASLITSGIISPKKV